MQTGGSCLVRHPGCPCSQAMWDTLHRHRRDNGCGTVSKQVVQVLGVIMVSSIGTVEVMSTSSRAR